MRPRTSLVPFLFALVALAPATAVQLAGQEARRPLALDDLSRLRSVGDPQVSPDGRWIAYTVGTTDAEKDKRETHVWMASWDGSERLQMTNGADSESMPRWSPDGRYLAFLAARGDEAEKKKGSQVWLLNRSGGEGRKLTDIKGGVADFVWSPDSARLALVVNDPDPDEEPEQKEGWKRKTRPPIVIDRYRFKQDREGYLTRLYSHLWVFDVAGLKGEAITSGNQDDASPAWSPDGRSIAFVSNRAPDPDRSNDTNLFVIEARPGAEPRQLTTFPGPDGGRPSWSPDGRWVAHYQGDESRFSAYNQSKVAVVAAGGGQPRLLTAALDRAASGTLLWSPDGRALTTVVEDDRTRYVARVPVVAGAVERLTSGTRIVSSLAPGPDGSFALLSATATEPPEVHVLEKGALRRVTGENDTLFGELQLGTTEEFTSRSKDGTEVHGLVVKPASFVAGRPYPTLLIIHGGPNGQDEHSFSFDREFFAAHGYVVAAVNYRGSAGRGSAYQKAIYGDWGNKEVVDLVGAIDHLVAIGVADPERLGIGGWSYGGILTDYTIATDPRFKAAVSGAGSAMQIAMYGTDQYVAQYDQEMGPPWKTQDAWLKISYPFLHADRIRTPTLFMGGDRDFNVPIIGGEQMYQALRSIGIDTELVVYPGQFHGLTMPSYQRDRLARYLAWFDRYLKRAGTTPTPDAPPPLSPSGWPARAPGNPSR